MKIFAVYGKLEISNMPQWLVDFVKKYKFDYDFHITFKQPCFIEENQTDDIKNALSDLFNEPNISNHKEIVFDRILPNKDCDCVMLGTSNNPKLIDLQKKIVEALRNYQNYCQPETKEYENNFIPHLTIAMDLNNKTYQKAIKNVPSQFQIIGEMQKIIMAVVDRNTPEESKNPKKLHTFYF